MWRNEFQFSKFDTEYLEFVNRKSLQWCQHTVRWHCGPTRAMSSSFLRFLEHTQRRTTVGGTTLETSAWQHTTLTTDKHPCPRQDSNPQSLQASGCRPTPYTAPPLGPALTSWNSLKTIFPAFLFLPITFLLLELLVSCLEPLYLR